MLVAGEAGIGKTWLLRAFTAQVAATARVLPGSCEDLLAPRTLGPFGDMARDAGGALTKVAGQDRDAFIDALLGECRHLPAGRQPGGPAGHRSA